MKRILLALVTLAVLCCGSNQPPTANAMPEPPKSTGYSAAPAEVAVGVIPAAVVHDAARNKDIEVALDYPAKGGPFPLIIFSHDFGGSDRSYEQLVAYWTTHGYVVARPSHADAGAAQDAMRAIFAERPEEQKGDKKKSQKETAKEMQERRAAAEMQAAAEVWTKSREPQWRDRVHDITLIIDSLDTLEQRYPELKGKISHDKIGVAGHSLGAFTAMLAGGVKTFSDPPLALGDARVRSVIAMSPPGISANRGLTAQSFADVKIPVMFMTGTEDRGASEAENANWRKSAFASSPAGDKYFVLLEGARRSSFLGTYAPIDIPQTTSIPMPQTRDPRNPYTQPEMVQQPRGGPVNPQVGRQVFSNIRVLSLAFWDAYLKGETKGKELLTKNSEVLGGVKVETK